MVDVLGPLLFVFVGSSAGHSERQPRGGFHVNTSLITGLFDHENVTGIVTTADDVEV